MALEAEVVRSEVVSRLLFLAHLCSFFGYSLYAHAVSLLLVVDVPLHVTTFFLSKCNENALLRRL